MRNRSQSSRSAESFYSITGVNQPIRREILLKYCFKLIRRLRDHSGRKFFASDLEKEITYCGRTGFSLAFSSCPSLGEFRLRCDGALIQPSLRHLRGQLADTSDHGRALRHRNCAARVQHIKEMRALQAKLVGLQERKTQAILPFRPGICRQQTRRIRLIKINDGVLVYFGWPEARETDAERAVRAGLAVAAVVSEIDVGGK